MGLGNVGKLLIIVGGLIAICGLALFVLGKGLGLRSLPGDILYRRGGFTFYFPLGVCILLSIVVTLLLNLFLRR